MFCKRQHFFNTDVEDQSQSNVDHRSQLISLQRTHSPYDRMFEVLPNRNRLDCICDGTISLLSAAYSTAFYNKAEEYVSYEVGSVKTKISKSRFSKLLGFTETKDLVDPETLQPVALQRLFHQMAYKGDITQLSKFSKKGLPPQWDALFTILFKSFSERTTGTDSHDIHVMKDSVMAIIPTMPTATFATSKAKDFNFIGAIPMTMLDRVPKHIPCIVDYYKTTTFAVRNLDETLQQAFEKLENPRKITKRKGRGAASDTEKQPKRSRILRKMVMRPHSEDEHSDNHIVTNPLDDDLDDNDNTNQRPPTPTPEHTPKRTPTVSPKH
ncbi:hypothetical protein L1887_11854 [Cichorium endivia]|nr:hypothetical protein L1887_11854 [Cichorium endivia]